MSNKTDPNTGYYILGSLLGLAAVGSFLWYSSLSVPTRAIIIALWLVGPPIYFFFEFHNARRDGADPTELAKLKDSQALAEKIWAGVAAALAIIYFKGS